MKLALRVLTIAIVVATATVLAGSRKVVVLPIDGDADAAIRTKLQQDVIKAARANGDNVTAGNTTFAETAAAVGCDATDAACADTVIATLNVDEVVYGTATNANGQTNVVVTRALKGQPRRDQTFALAATDPPDKSDAQLRGLYTTVPAGGSGSDLGSGSGSAIALGSGGEEPSFFDTTERKLGVGFVAGGVVALAVGAALWSSESSVQAQIDAAPSNTTADIANLKTLEDRANRYAWGGNVLVVLGLAAGGVGAYYLWTDHKQRAAATVTPVEHGQGAAVVVRGTW